MNGYLSTLVAMLVVALPPANGQAPVGDRPPEVDTAAVWRMGDTVQSVGGGPRAETATDDFVGLMGAGVPENDSHKWFISVVSMKGCSVCAKLKADWAKEPALLAFANPADSKESWAHLNFYMVEDKSQAWRWEKIRLTAFPTIIIQPPRDGSYGNPSAVVGQLTGYTSAKQLNSDMTVWFKKYLAKHFEKRKADLGPVKNGIGQGGQIGIDPPWAPTPKADPVVPATPSFPFDLNPKPAPAVEPPVAPVANYDEVLVVTSDGANPYEDPRMKRLIDKVRGAKRVRLVDWESVKDRLRIARDDLPAVVVTDSEGKVADKISGRLLPLVRDVGIMDLPWASIIALLAGGFSFAGIVPLIGWGLKKIRDYRVASGQTPFLTEEQLAQVITTINALAAKKTPDQK